MVRAVRARAASAGSRRALTSYAALLAEMNADAGEMRQHTGRGQRLAFIAQDDLPPGAAYEAHIASTGCVPTRHNLHDFFNGSMWFAFPRIKAALNARQSAAIDVLGVGPTRGGVRDTLTLFDENALLFACADPALSAALRGFDWQTLLVARRDAWGSRCEVRCFGHALLEKLIAPFKACTGHAWIVDVPAEYFRMGRRRTRRMARRGGQQRRCSNTDAFDEPHVCAAARAGHSGLVGRQRIARVLRRHVRVSGGATFALKPHPIRPSVKIRPSKAGQAVAASAASVKEGEESPDSTGQGDG